MRNLYILLLLSLSFGQFQPQTKAELQTAVDLWVDDNDSALSTYGEINTWDVSFIEDMSYLFYDKTTFNDNILNWDVSGVTHMGYMFVNAESFNWDLSSWDVSACNAFYAIFVGANALSDQNKCAIHTAWSFNSAWGTTWTNAWSEFCVVAGCTNPEASNYNPDATVDDGSCCIELWGECYNIEETTYLNFYNNELTGEIPPEIGQLTNLTSLSLQKNHFGCYEYNFDGGCPSWEQSECCIIHCDETDECSGEIPPEIGQLTNLTELNLEYNQLSGEIPVEICNQGAFYPLLHRNQLCPPYPDCLNGYTSIGDQNTSECCGGEGLPEGVCDCEGVVWDECSVCGGDGLPCSVNISITNVNITEGIGFLDIYMLSEVDIGGFQFVVSGVTLNSMYGGTANEYLDAVNFNETSGNVLGFSMSGDIIPPGEGVLMTFIFSDYIDEICINDVLFTDPTGEVLYDTNDADCFAIIEGCIDPNANNYNPDATVDDGSCEYDCNLGDVNGDGTSDVMDIVQLVDCILVDSCDGTLDYSCAGDINGDGEYDIMDVVQLVICVLEGNCEDDESSTTNAVSIANMAFNPSTLTIAIGETITWTLINGTHTVVSYDETWQSGSMLIGGTYSYQFDTAGTFDYKCGYHSTMTGTIIVTL